MKLPLFLSLISLVAGQQNVKNRDGTDGQLSPYLMNNFGDSENDSNGLNQTAVIAIAVASVAVLLLLIAVVCWCKCRSKNNKTEPEDTKKEVTSPSVIVDDLEADGSGTIQKPMETDAEIL